MAENVLDKVELDRAKQAISNASKIVIISHRSPDADAIGSNTAFRKVFENLGKQVVSACCDELPDVLKFLYKSNEFVRSFQPEDFDLVITCDCGSLDQVQFFKEIEIIKNKSIPFLNIDHHISNNFFGAINLVEPKLYAATCEIAYHMFSYFGFDFDNDIATSLLTGLYYDTGKFMHSNTSSGNLEIAGDLINKGADFELIVRSLYRNNPIEQLKLWGVIWNRARMNDKNIVVSAVTKEDLDLINVKKEYITGAIDYLNSVKDAKFCILLTDDGEKIKASVRTQRDDIDLCQFSSVFGGGGHRKASGFSVPGKIEKQIEFKWKLSV